MAGVTTAGLLNAQLVDSLSAQTIVVMAFLSLSITACLAALIHFIKTRASFDTPTRLMINLAVSDCVGATFWLTDFVFGGTLCPYAGVINMMGYQAAELWTCVIGVYLIMTCSGKDPPREWVFYVVAYGIPAALQVVVLNMELYQSFPLPHGCWMSYGTLNVAFATIPELIAVTINISCLATMVYKMKLSAKRWGIKSQHRGLFLVQVCFLMTTISAVIETVPDAPDILYEVGACFGALQGFFNSVAIKQTVLRQFLGTVRDSIQVPIFRGSNRRFGPLSSSVSATTWLLQPEQQQHPAISDDLYEDYYRQAVRSSAGENGDDGGASGSDGFGNGGRTASGALGLVDMANPNSPP